MRIVGGLYRGRTLYSFEGESVRPTPDMVREALFNVLQFKINGARFLDLFCGTGAMGIEALSRGAKRVLFNDKARESVNLTKKNLEKVKAQGDFSLCNQDGVELVRSGREKFDIIYIDPPYKAELGLTAVESAINSLADGGVIIYESESEFVGEIKGLTVTDKRKYGRVRLTFFEKGVQL